jgi:hypothetical protein
LARKEEANKAVELLLSKFDANKSTALSRVSGEDISPLILVYLPYSSVAKNAHIELMRKELQEREVSFNLQQNILQLRDLLKNNEKKRYAAEVDKKLQQATTGVELDEVKQLTIQEKLRRLKSESGTDSQFDVDIVKYFKAQLEGLGEKLLEEREEE